MKDGQMNSCFFIRTVRLQPSAVRIASLFILALGAIAVQANPPIPDGQYIMGVFPHLPPRQLEKVFSPMASDLGKAVNQRIILRTNTTFERFSQSLDTQVFDIAFVQPFDYVRIADKYGYRPLAARSEDLAAMLVVKEDSPLNTLQDLRGMKIALPPAVAAVSYLIRDLLQKNGLDPDKDVTLSHHRSHMSCLQQVLIRAADACGTAAPPLRFFQHRMKVKMKVVATSREIPHALFVIHPRVPDDKKQAIRQRIISWSDTEDGKQLLERGRLKPFVQVSDSDYDVIRRMTQ
jgi:phosphonate transport system substrate-binding protein